MRAFVRVGTLVAVTVMLACSSERERIGTNAGAIQGGVADPAASPIVAILECSGACVFNPYLNATGVCSGVLVTPTLIVTARHCVSPSLDANPLKCSKSTFGPSALAANFLVIPAPTIYAGGPWFEVAQVDVAPGDSNLECGNDVAVLHLAKPYDGATPLVPRLDVPPQPGELYSAIGYGDDGTGNGTGVRRRRDNLKVKCLPPNCPGVGPDLKPFIVPGEVEGETGVCGGDSGGPAVAQDGRIIGVVSRGNEGNCSLPVYSRLDPWAGWLRTHAVRAAIEGGYGVPAWAQFDESDDAGPVIDARPVPADAAGDAEPREVFQTGGGCGVAGERASPWSAWPVVLAVGIRRRRRR